MFLGHLAVGFASKRAAPRTSLGWFVAAPLFLDLVWPFFLATGVERVRIDPGNTAFTPLAFDHYPWSHSLLMAVVWSVAFGASCWFVTRSRPAALLVSLGVASHWLCDWITHRPDLPLYPGGALYGLGLWNSIPGTLVVEFTMLALGLWLLRPKGIKLWSLMVFCLVAAMSAAFGPPPPSAGALIATAFAIWLVPLWAWWGDREKRLV